MASDAQVLKRLVERMKNSERDPLRPLVDEYIMIRDQAENRLDRHKISMTPRPRPPGRISPSAIGGCPRAAVFRFVGVRGRKGIDPDLELLFENGNWQHHKWQALFLDMEQVLGKDVFEVVSIEENVQYGKLYVAGALDLHVRIHGVDYIIDIKGINSRGFSWVQHQDEPKHDNVLQLLMYMRAKGVKRGIIWYDCKDNQLTKGFVVKFSAEEFREVREWCRGVLTALERRRLPQRPAECQSGTMLFEKCVFARLCYGKLDTVDLVDMTYDAFSSIDEQWELGNGVVEEHASRVNRQRGSVRPRRRAS
jgi:hypothetical protein